MLSKVICSIPYLLIDTIKYNDMWEYINILSLTNREIGRLTKEYLLEIYVETIKINVKKLGQNPYILPGKVMAYIYKDTISVSVDKYYISGGRKKKNPASIKLN